METKKITLTFLALCMLCAAVTEGMSLARISEPRCLCINTESTFIHPKHFQNVELIPKGPNCPNVEVIVTLKTGKEVCIDPSAPWVEKIIKRILDSSKTK
ncbi:interleukin-8 [Bombina bombina]|uniref:interleukin-8 n=1 Tax=Bombina bombina TaxID=8345 RepID=UPI00235AC392|nr:interleukin-8 [Bombina bombina]